VGRPPVEDAYLAELVARIGPARAVYLTGSAALGAYVPGRSDLDVMVVVDAPLGAEERDAIVARCSHDALPCPARKLELVVYTAEQVAAPRREQRWELNLNTGEGEQHAGTDPSAEPWFWFVLDLALAREHAVALHGPPAAELIGEVPRPLVLDAMADTVAWYARNEPGEGAVLAAARAWLYAEEGVFASKRDALQWARHRGSA
jgi:Nucleotidyltransferase domain/Domain of unknown function (DUF4111)